MAPTTPMALTPGLAPKLPPGVTERRAFLLSGLTPMEIAQKRRGPNLEWSCEEDDILRANFHSCSARELIPMIGRPLSGIQAHAARLGLRKSGMLGAHGKHRKYAIDESYWQRGWSERMAYVFGFGFADGHLNHKGSPLEFYQKEAEILEKIAEELGYSGPVERTKRGQHVLRVYSRAFCSDLHRLGFPLGYKRSSPLPEVPAEFQRHFLRGYSDANASWGFYNGSAGRPIYYLRWTLCGPPQMMGTFRDWVVELVGVKHKAVYACSGGSRCTSIVYASSEAKAIRDLMYDGATIWMEFKRVQAHVA